LRLVKGSFSSQRISTVRTEPVAIFHPGTTAYTSHQGALPISSEASQVSLRYRARFSFFKLLACLDIQLESLATAKRLCKIPYIPSEYRYEEYMEVCALPDHRKPCKMSAFRTDHIVLGTQFLLSLLNTKYANEKHSQHLVSTTFRVPFYIIS